jgi:1-acyl-sn-glycerol-3-phosphate acyltransferase
MATGSRSGDADAADARERRADEAPGDRLRWWAPRDGVWPPAWRFGSEVLKATIPSIYRTRVAGREHLPPSGGLLVVSSHVHDIDPPFMAWAVRPRPIQYVAAAHNFEGPVLGHLISALGAFPLRTDRPDIRGLRYAWAQLELGRAVLIFPEGRPSYDAPVAPFLQGAGLLALAEGVTVVPAAIAGTNQVVDAHRVPRLRGPVGIAFGAPVAVPAGGTRRDRAAAVIEDARERVLVLDRWLRSRLARDG